MARGPGIERSIHLGSLRKSKGSRPPRPGASDTRHGGSMNEVRLDDLAKSLATNRISRWQAIKTLCSGLMLTGSLGALAATPAGAETGAPCPECGTCKRLIIDSDSGTVRIGTKACSADCAAASICTQANRRGTHYLKLKRFLIDRGFAPAVFSQSDFSPSRVKHIAIEVSETEQELNWYFGAGQSTKAPGRLPYFVTARAQLIGS